MKVPEIHVLLRIPPWSERGLPIFWYGVMLLVGFLSAMWLARRLARREGVPPERIYDLALWAILSGLLGARLWFVVENADRFYGGPDAPRSFLAAVGRTLNVSDGGLVFYGGILLPIVVLVWWFRRRGLPVLKMLDILSPPAMLGLFFGRWGCFFNGCCFGRVVADGFPLGVRRPRGGGTWWYQVEQGLIGRDAAWSLPVHPTQLYSSAAALLICGALLLLYRRKRREGDILAWLLLLYPVARGLIEGLRAHEPEAIVGPMSVAQAVSAGAFLVGVLLWVFSRYRPLAVPFVPAPGSAGDEAPATDQGKNPAPRSRAARRRGAPPGGAGGAARRGRRK